MTITIKTKHTKSLLLAGVSCLCSFAITNTAQAESIQRLEDVVVSANKTPTAASHIGSSVTVITAEDLKEKQAVTLADALQEVPGLYSYSNGNAAAKTRFKLRGYDSGRVLVLIDGVKIDNQASQMYDRPFNHLQAADIERIEVLRGSQSALYGSDAIGGVISITTKSGKNSGKLIEGQATLELGTNVTRQASASVWGSYKGAYYKFSGAGFATHGDDNRKNVEPDESDGSKNVNYNAKLGADVLKDYGYIDLINIEGNFGYQNGDAEYDTSSAANDSDGFYNQRTETGHLQLKVNAFDGLLENTFSISRMEAYINVRSKRQDSKQSEYRGELQRYEYQGTVHPIENHSIVFGVEQERDHYSNNKIVGSVTSGYETASLLNSGVFAQYGVDLFDKSLSLTLGTREEFHDTFGQHNTYRGTASYLYAPTETRFHTSYGTGFKAPTLIQALYHRELAPTEDVKPEESRSYDFGIEQSLLDGRMVVDVTAFNSRMTNQIESRGSSGSRYYVNIGSARHMGFETTADFEATEELNFSLTHTYTQSRNNTTGMDMDYTPHHVASLRADYNPKDVEGLGTWIKANAVSGAFNESDDSRERVGGYTTWDLGANYEINKNFSVYGRVENLFDKNYGQMYKFTNAGISASTGLRMKF